MAVSNPFFPNVAKTNPCVLCGYDLPQDLGQNSTTCRQWAIDTLRKLMGAKPGFNTIIDLVIFTRLCDIAASLNRRNPTPLVPHPSNVVQPEVRNNG